MKALTSTILPLYLQCLAARTLSYGGKFVSFLYSRAPSSLQEGQCRYISQENSLHSDDEMNEGTQHWDSSYI